jgi:hypothetical protein
MQPRSAAPPLATSRGQQLLLVAVVLIVVYDVVLRGGGGGGSGSSGAACAGSALRLRPSSSSPATAAGASAAASVAAAGGAAGGAPAPAPARVAAFSAEDYYGAIERKFDMLDAWTRRSHEGYRDRTWGVASVQRYAMTKTRFIFATLTAAFDPSAAVTVCELGFNAGHSAMLFLETLPNARVVSFDLGDTRWALENKARASARRWRQLPLRRRRLPSYLPHARISRPFPTPRAGHAQERLRRALRVRAGRLDRHDADLCGQAAVRRGLCRRLQEL